MKFTVEQIAKVAHEINKAYCLAYGDESQPDWEDAPQWQKDSAVTGVVFHLYNPEVGPEASHESWMAEKVRDGWIFGYEKDPDNKIHPCIVPFDKLPSVHKAKDYLFRQIVHSLGNMKSDDECPF